MHVGTAATVHPLCHPVADSGDLEMLLEAYDRERRALPAPVQPWQWGFTASAETWNGRIAMLAIILILVLEVTTGRSILSTMMTID